MIYLLVTKRGAHTFRDYLNDWTGDMRLLFELRFYEDFMKWPAEHSATYIFSDIERLTDAQYLIACDYADHLQREYPESRVINHPQQALRRGPLLCALNSAGINKFNAYPILSLPEEIRYPVFLRREREHEGPASRLVEDFSGLRFEALRLAMAGVRMEELLVVEYCETKSRDGLYRKYSAFRIGDHFIPAHIIFSNHWVTKDGNSTAEQIAEEAAYELENPHESWLRSVFDLANIEYGRIDYSMLDGQPQIWEINTNPILLKSRAEYEKNSSEALPGKERLASVMKACFSELNVTTPIEEVSARRSIVVRRFSDMIASPRH